MPTAFIKLILCCKTVKNVKVKMTFNTYMVNNWKHLCQKFNVPEGVALKNLIGKENEATVVQEVTEGSINRNTDRDRGLLEDVEEEDDNL
jgi:hypothetical protein